MTPQMLNIERTDTEIGRHVNQELGWDNRVENRDVRVSVDSGVVMLDGTVPTLAQKLAVADAAHRVSGVLDVVNEIQVVPPASSPRTDAEIAHAVRQALEWDALVPHQDIRCTVANGWVKLEGTVHQYSERAEAERAVKYLLGVKGISDAITVAPPQVNVRGVREAIERALERQIEREARRIRVEVNDGTVSLTGGVRSWAERRAVIGVAAHAPGVRTVEDHLFIEAAP